MTNATNITRIFHKKGRVMSFIMRAFKIWYLFGFVVVSFCANEVEYEGNYADSYDNEISQDQQEELFPAPCQDADMSRWDKLFVALEDSHMRQNMLLESLKQCCGGMLHLRIQVDKLLRAACQPCSVSSACRAQVEQVNVRLQRELDELREEESEREMRLNATLQMLLLSSHERNAWLKHLEEDRVTLSGAADSRMRHQPVLRPDGLGAAFSSGMKPRPSGLKEQEVTTPLDTTTREKALVAMATELEKVHLQLNGVIAQVETLRKDRGDT